MTDLSPLCALGSASGRCVRFGKMTLSENPRLGLASLSIGKGHVPVRPGLDLPGPGQWVEGKGVAAFWIGPDQWMVEFPDQAGRDVAAMLAQDAPGCAVTEQTDGFVAFDLEGPEIDLLAVLEKLVNIDISAFAPGSVTRTGLHHMSVFVIRRRTDRISFLGIRSAAGSLWEALAAAATRRAVVPD